MKAISEPSRRRLVLLNRLLCTAYEQKNITSQRISELLGYSPALIRRDISLLGIKCGSSNGYNVEELQNALNELLFFSQERHSCCIVGLGRMGQLLLETEELEGSPFCIKAGFDPSVNRTEVLRSSFPLHPTTLLEQVVREQNIEYALLTIQNEAQSLANRLARCGIKGIVNYTSVVLTGMHGVKIENASLLTALEMLSST